MPVSTSPMPPVAMPGLPVGFTNTRPSGVATIVRCPLSTTYSWWVSAKSLGHLDPVRLHVGGRHANQACQLAGVRRDDHVPALRTDQQLRRLREGVERVRVEHQWHAGPLEQAAHEGGGAGPRAEAGPHGHDVHLPGQHVLQRLERDAALGPLLERVRHVSGAMAATIGWHLAGVATVTRPAPDFSAPMAVRCAAPSSPAHPPRRARARSRPCASRPAAARSAAGRRPG